MTENQAQTSVCCAVAPPSNATAQQHPFRGATDHATGAQRNSLKALAIGHLSRNSTRNDSATEEQKGAQQTGKKTGHFVARVAGEIDGSETPSFARLIAAAARLGGCNGGHSGELIESLKQYPPDSWGALIGCFERQLRVQQEAQQDDNQNQRTVVHIPSLTLADGKKVSCDLSIPVSRLPELEKVLKVERKSPSALPPELGHAALAACKAYGDGKAAQDALLEDLSTPRQKSIRRLSSVSERN